MTERSFTQRGFENFATFTDSHGNDVVVRESSEIGEPCVWVFCGHGVGDVAPRPSAHLTKEQARSLAEALMQFVNREEETDGD